MVDVINSYTTFNEIFGLSLNEYINLCIEIKELYHSSADMAEFTRSVIRKSAELDSESKRNAWLFIAGKMAGFNDVCVAGAEAFAYFEWMLRLGSFMKGD